MPVLSWWALATVLTRASTTLTMLAVLIVGIFLYLAGQTTVGEIVMFMSFATMLIGKLEAGRAFRQSDGDGCAAGRGVFRDLDTEPAVRDRPDAIDPGRLRGLVEFKDVSFSYDGKRPAVGTSTSPRCPARPSRSSARPAPANRPHSRCCIASSIRNRAR